MKLFQKNYPDIWFTMGPSSIKQETIEKMILAGATGVRLTFSYGTPEIQEERAKLVKKAAEKVGMRCNVIADLQGEKIRLEDFGLTHMPVSIGDKIIISKNTDLRSNRISVNMEGFSKTVSEGDILVIGDGSVELLAKQVKDEVVCEVLTGGTINPNRGIVVRSESFQPSCLVDKDISDLEKISDSNMFDAIAPSFVSSEKDILKIRKMANKPIIAKIETKKGFQNRSEIIEASDGILVARGDLALSFDWAELGNVVEKIVDSAVEAAKPWVMATQLAEGLEKFAFPTRAEICDISRWVKAGASCFMLSSETSFGPRPIDSVVCVKKIIDASVRDRRKAIGISV